MDVGVVTTQSNLVAIYNQKEGRGIILSSNYSELYIGRNLSPRLSIFIETKIEITD